MEKWYHGTPDVTGLEKDGGFTSRTISVEYLTDVKGFYNAQNLMKKARESGDDDMYLKTLDSVPSFKGQYKMRKPVFLSNDYSVARTYADPRRSFDYQMAREKVLEIELEEGSVVKIMAIGERFRFIEVSKVKQGFVNAGVPSNKLDDLIERLLFAQQDKSRIKTDAIAVLGEWFKFDYIDVIGVLDSYHGGSKKSTVRMVFDTNKIKILSNMSENKVKGGLADGKSIRDIVLHHGKDSWDSIQFESLEKQIKAQLEKGIKVELEHTDDETTAREIAMDHLWEDPKYYDKLEKVEETRSIIKKLLRENVKLSVTDEAPDSISVLVQYNDRNAGIITVTPSPKEDDMLELVNLKFKEGYEEPHIMQDALNSLWSIFPNINSIIVAPEKESIAFWNRMRFNRISPNYLISNRGH
jgi:ribulose bisphosphate carboxylase small subunit